ncbi:serine/threonine-protein kinase DCLK1 isoform X2 [Odontomachus brunneus]|uniref:serine/threonine-protein kinase DCLK1 isoform X2 n=1 Tax=Odontomachus brunneus TaxID=486640 RepID=UPI0013F18A3D|nr:serine/threonine-protein kinase DCLK1 isoform X2 [Odontomachus brunneus]
MSEMMEEPLSQGASPSSDGNFSTVGGGDGSGGDLNSSSTIVSLDERILDVTSRHTLNVLRTPLTKKAKRVRFFRNGDKYYTGVVMAVTPERYRSFDSLASDLTRALVSSVTLPNGVRAIYTMDGRKVQSVSDLEDGKCYVVSGQGEIFKKVEYSSSKVRRGSSLSGLPQSPAATGTGSGGTATTTVTGRQTSAIPLCVKARIVTLIRHGTKPRKVLRLLLNKRNAPSLEHAMEAITEAVKLDSGAVRKVYTLSGQQVTSLEQFFQNDDIFVAYGPEKSAQEDFELDFEETKYVQSFRRCLWSSKRQSGPMPRMPRKSGKKTLTTPQVRTPSPSSSILPQPLRLHYAVGHIIGEGNFAVVRHCIHKSTGAEYAVKIVDMYRCQGKEMLASEVAILRQVCHPNIISLIAEQETTNQLFLVMELVKGGDLFDAIAAATKFSEAEASVMISHLTSALAYLHSHHIVHRDVKPENLLVEMDGSHVRCLKLGDFGLAQVVREPLYTVCGTPTYVAPEILAETGYGLKIDVWAAGVILYILLCGFPPFVSPENEQEELFERILSGQYEFTSPYWDAISDSAKQLISNMLQAQPELRFSAEDVLDHPWLASFLGGEQTPASAAPTGTAKQHWDQQRKPIRLATFEFDFKKQRGNRQDSPNTEAARTSARTEWKLVDAPPVKRIELREGSPKERRDCDEIDFANGNRREEEEKEELGSNNDDDDDDDDDDDNDNGDSAFLQDMHSLSRSMHDLINNLNLNLNEDKTSRCRLTSRSAASSLNSIPENLNSSSLQNDSRLTTTTCNYNSNSSIHCDEKIAENLPATPRNCRGDKKNGNTPKAAKYLDIDIHCETPKLSSKRTLDSNGRICNRRNLFDSDDFRNSNVSTAVVSTSSESSLSHSSTGGNDIETSDSFVNIQFARLARGRKSSSTQSMESTDSFENVSFRYVADTNDNGRLPDDSSPQIPSKHTAHGSHRVRKSATKSLPQTRIAALNSTSRSVKLDNQAEGKTCSSGSPRIQETNKCTRNEPVKLRYERYIGKKGQVDSKHTSKNKRYSCFSPCTAKKSSAEEEAVGDDKVVTRKFNSTDELREGTAERQKPMATKTKRFSLYYTPQPLRKTYLETDTRTGRIPCKSTARANKSMETNKSKDEEAERSRRSVADASTIASRSKSNRQNVHVRPNVVNASLITSRTK